jgi:hypothetical protein
LDYSDYKEAQKAEQVARANVATGGNSVACPASETPW